MLVQYSGGSNSELIQILDGQMFIVTTIGKPNLVSLDCFILNHFYLQRSRLTSILKNFEWSNQFKDYLLAQT